MKRCVVIIFILTNPLLTSSVGNSVSSSIEDFRLNNPKHAWSKVTKELMEELRGSVHEGGCITAVMNEYADEIIANVAELIISNGLDPVELPNSTLNLIPTGHIILDDGWLQDLSMISRLDDVKSTYKPSERLLIVTVPLKFDALLFTYKYHTHVLLLNINGDVNGKVEKVKFHVTLQFDFNTYKAALTEFDMKNTGKISVEFSGNGLVDWITNSMTSVVSLFLHPIIIGMIELIVRVPLNDIVDAINRLIVCVLTPAKCDTK